MPQARLMLFAKAPFAGHAKTRLIPEIGARAAAQVHRQLVEHTLATLCQIKHVRLELHCGDAHPFLWRMARRYGCVLRPQVRGNLGQRMLTALQQEPSCGLIVGSDCPTLASPMIERSLDALRGPAHAVVLPAEDGGYGLIGCRQPQDPRVVGLFRDIPWGTGEVLSRTRHRAKEMGLELQELDMVWDIDTPTDLQRWYNLIQR